LEEKRAVTAKQLHHFPKEHHSKKVEWQQPHCSVDEYFAL
jgi:hypothetical protein